MPNIPGYLWPEPNVQLNGTTVVVKQARWRQLGSFLDLVEPAKWMVVVWTGTPPVLRYGTVPSSGSTVWAGEMPLTQKSVAIDLSAWVDAATPLYPTVKVQQYAGTRTATGWNWATTNWENQATPLITYIDSIGGEPRSTTRVWEPEAVTDPWNPLSRGFYDEGCVTPDDFAWSPGDNSSNAPSGSVGMPFVVILPACRIEGVQIWIPPEVFAAMPVPKIVTVRLWKGKGHAPPTAVVRQDDITIQFAGWTNFFWTEGFMPADTKLIPDTSSAGNPYPYKTNPLYDGSYVIGFQTDGGKYRSGPVPSDYSPLFPEHAKVYMSDNYPAGSQWTNRLSPVGEKGGDWAPNFNIGHYLFVGPIMSYIPIYPVPRPLFNQQIYRRVGAAQ